MTAKTSTGVLTLPDGPTRTAASATDSRLSSGSAGGSFSDFIRSSVAEGLSDYQIAANYGCSRSTVQKARIHLGLAPVGKRGNFSIGDLPRSVRPFFAVGFATSEEVDDEIRRLVARGLSDEKISQCLGIGRSAIHARRKRAGIPPGQGSGVESLLARRREEVRRRAAAGETDRQIAEAFGVHRRVVWKLRKRWDIAPGLSLTVRMQSNPAPRLMTEFPTPRMPDEDPFTGLAFADDPRAARPEPRWRGVNTDWGNGGRQL